MKAIETKYHGPTNSRGSRFSAKDSDGNRVTLPHDYALNSYANHEAAAVALVQKMGWGPARIIGGATREGYAFVFVIDGDVRNIEGGGDD